MIYLILSLWALLGYTNTETGLIADQKFLTEAKQKNELLLKALADCRPYEMQLSNPLITKNPLKSKVHGLQKDQRCLFTQNLPQGAIKTCYFTPQQRQEIKASGQKAFIRAMTDPKACNQTGNNL